MKSEIRKMTKSIYDVPYTREAFNIFRNSIDLMENFVRASNFLNSEKYFVEMELIDELVSSLSTRKSDEDRLLQKKIQRKIANLCRTILDENKKIFIVHGRNISMRDKVSSILGRLKLDYVILESESNNGSTVIEKFISNAKDCEYAIVLFSSDDVGKLNSDDQQLKPRVRQNVVLELGFFLSHVGRKNIVVFHDPRSVIEKPSDFNGVVYEAFDEYGAWKHKLMREMRSNGIYIKPDLADRI